MLRILTDTPALNSPHGSGIKTYTLNLLRAQGLAGYESHLLYETPWSKDPSLNELYAGQFAHGKSPSFLHYYRHKLKTLAGISTRPRLLQRRPHLILEARNRPEYRWLAQLPAWTDKNIYSLARSAHRFSGRFTTLDNPGGTFDIWHAAFQRPLRLKNAKNVVTIHDLIPLRLPETNNQPKKEWYRLVKTSCLTADLILATSHSTKRDLLEFFDLPEERVQVVYQCPEICDPLPPQETRSMLETLGLSAGKYFLFVGNIEPRKNLRRIIQAWLRLDGKTPLVIAGHKAWLWENELSHIPAGTNIHLLGYVSPEEKATLYRNALCLVFPSLYEGFGIPPLEAMMSGLPVITSHTSAMPEICGDAALYVNPGDVNTIAKAMTKIQEDPALRSTLVEKGVKQASLFSLENFSRQLTGAYEQVLGSSLRLRSKSPKRFVLITLAIGPKAQKLMAVSRPGLMDYARRIGADYHEVTESGFPGQSRMVFYNKLKLRKLLDRYERVLYMDCDIIVSPGAPDLFRAVPETHLGCCFETIPAHRTDPIAHAQKVMGKIDGWDRDFFNAGLMVVSQSHKHLFDPLDKEPPDFNPGAGENYDDQSYLNWQARNLAIPIHQLNPRFNWAPSEGETPNGRVINPGAWMVHFCSEGFEYLRSRTDDLFTYKFHQMTCWSEKLKGRHIQRIHPNQFYMDSGSLDQSSFPIRFSSGSTPEGQRVAYGPYRKMENGYYRFRIEPDFSGSTKASTFRVALCAERGKRWILETTIGPEPSAQSFYADLQDVEDLEVSFYAGSVPYTIEHVEIEKLF
jgi:glycosyltransferase involved in cell wall biosynthesis